MLIPKAQQLFTTCQDTYIYRERDMTGGMHAWDVGIIQREDREKALVFLTRNGVAGRVGARNVKGRTRGVALPRELLAGPVASQ